MSFSERYGYADSRGWLQREEIDRALQVRIWNVLDLTVFRGLGNTGHISNASQYDDILRFWWQFCKLPVDTIPDADRDAGERIRDFYFKRLAWNEVYDLVEFIAAEFGTVDAELPRATQPRACHRAVSLETVW